MSVNVIRYYVKSQTKSVCLDLCEIMFNLCQIGKHKMLSMSLDMSISNWSLEQHSFLTLVFVLLKVTSKQYRALKHISGDGVSFLEMIQK